MLVPLLDAGEVRVGAVTARQVLLVEGCVLADQVTVGLVDVGERPQLAGLPLAARCEPYLVAAKHVVSHGGHVLRREDELRAVLVDLGVLKQQDHVAQKLRVQLGIQLVDDHGAAALERCQQKRRQPHELLRAGRLLGQPQLIAPAIHVVPHEDALAAPLGSLLHPKAADAHVHGAQEAHDLGRVCLVEHLLERPLQIRAVVVQEHPTEKPAGCFLDHRRVEVDAEERQVRQVRVERRGRRELAQRRAEVNLCALALKQHRRARCAQLAPPQPLGHDLVGVHGQDVAVLVLACAVVELELGGLGDRHVVERERRTASHRGALPLGRVGAGGQQPDRPGHRRSHVVEGLEKVGLAAGVGAVHRGHRQEALPVGTLDEGTLELPHRRRLHGQLRLVAVGPVVPKGELAKHCPQHPIVVFELNIRVFL